MCNKTSLSSFSKMLIFIDCDKIFQLLNSKPKMCITIFWPRKVLTLSGRCQIWSNDQNDVSDKKTNFSNHKQTGFETLFSKYHLSSLLEEACGKLPLLCSASSNSVIFQFICLGLQIMVFTYLHSE